MMTIACSLTFLRLAACFFAIRSLFTANLVVYEFILYFWFWSQFCGFAITKVSDVSVVYNYTIRSWIVGYAGCGPAARIRSWNLNCRCLSSRRDCRSSCLICEFPPRGCRDCCADIGKKSAPNAWSEMNPSDSASGVLSWLGVASADWTDYRISF